MELLRGEIYWANLEPARGSEQGGIRPVLIIQNNIGNESSPTTIVAAITSKNNSRDYLFNVLVTKKESKLPKDSTIMLNQIRTIDNSRLIKKIGRLNEFLMHKVNQAIRVSLDLE